MKTLILMAFASAAFSQNYTAYNNQPVARTSWLRNQGYSGHNLFGDVSLSFYLPMADCYAGPFNDLSNHGVIATQVGAFQGLSQIRAGKTGKCAPYFNKSVTPNNKYDVTPTPTVTVPWTLMAWAIPNNPTVTSQYARVIETYYNTGLYLGGDPTSHYVTAVKNTFSTPAGNLVLNSWPNGPWVFLTQVYDGTNILFYVNGALQNTVAAASPGTQTITMDIGYCSTAGAVGCSSFAGAWDGQIQGARLYSRALVAAEILVIYNAENH